ncbi:MAG: oligoendopeptidase F family protein, partial [Oscillospiraceae bacterium]|nr:oligoendopeptidase F family protein [Oscillospiraceae bacterium]
MLDPSIKRSDVPEEFTWRLEDMYPTDKAWAEENEALRALVPEVAAFSGRLGESADTLLSFFRLSDDIAKRLSTLYGYASCRADQDQGNGFYQDMRGKAMNTYVAVSSASSFSTPEIMAIPDERLDAFRAERPELSEYERSIYQIRRKKEHILTPAEERLLAASGEMASAPGDIGSIFRNADLTYPDAVDSNGVSHTLTAGSFVPLEESGDRTLRESAFKALYGRLSEFKNTAATILDYQFKKLRFYSEARGYKSTLEASLDETEVPTEVYRNLISAVHGNLDKMHRYVSLRKKLLGVDELHMYDIYTPIVADAARKIDYEEAKSTVLEALSVLGEDYVDLLKTAFNNRWIDVYENVGKRSGAYSSGQSFPHPYVLLNHKDTLDSMFTLAHELGHAMHSYHSAKYQPISTSDYVIFVAEVASTVNEVLLMRYLLSKTEDKKERAYLINHFLDSFK